MLQQRMNDSCDFAYRTNVLFCVSVSFNHITGFLLINPPCGMTLETFYEVFLDGLTTTGNPEIAINYQFY